MPPSSTHLRMMLWTKRSTMSSQKDRDFQDFLKTAHAKQVAPALRVRKGPSNGAAGQPTKKLAAGVESTASVRAVKP
jgi:hypothetical protein